ncbi:hypothetical protein PsYK624_030090 [Phanerochaete sordida]|uniref:Uncharacterized protein n=1 Tax=Phanerochaete sordida TaxID=48140 RepID=A0A9P3G2A2_9APHY|nr:hypothetical protein PsYK624_030090 [Phanerochaete sordida]
MCSRCVGGCPMSDSLSGVQRSVFLSLPNAAHARTPADSYTLIQPFFPELPHPIPSKYLRPGYAERRRVP